MVHNKVRLCKVKLLIRYSRDYPYSPPTIEIIDQENLPEPELKKINNLIEEEIEAHSDRQDMMVFDLCQNIMDILNIYAEPIKKYVYKVDLNSMTMWDQRQEQNKTKGFAIKNCIFIFR